MREVLFIVLIGRFLPSKKYGNIDNRLLEDKNDLPTKDEPELPQ